MILGVFVVAVTTSITSAGPKWSDCLIQSNASGGLLLASYMVVGVVSNTIAANGETGFYLNLDYGGISASGITGNVIRNSEVGMQVTGISGPPVLTLAGNDIYQNTSSTAE